MSAAYQKWEVERNMRRHWERLDLLAEGGGRLRQSLLPAREGKRQGQGRRPPHSSSAPSLRSPQHKQLRQQSLLQKSNEEMVSRLFAILDPPHTVAGTGGARSKEQRRQQEQEAAYLERRSYRARVLRGVRAAREAELLNRNEVLRKQIEAVGPRVPGHQALQQEYQERQAKHEAKHKFQVSPTTLHLIPKQKAQVQKASAQGRPLSGAGMRGGDGRGGGGDGPGHRLPAWYLNAREEVGDEEKEALAETFADFLRRPRTASGKGYRKGGGKQQHRPHSASCTRDHRNLQLRRDDDGDISPCGMEGGEEGLDWLMYSEQEVRVELLGVGAGAGCDTVAGGDAVAPKSSPSSPPVPMQKMQPLKMPTDTQRIHEQQGGREQTQQKEPIRGLAEQRPPYRSARHQFLASLMSGGTDEGANLCRDLLLLPGPQGAERGEGESPSPACRVRCSLLCELPSQRVRLPSHAHEQQVCPSVSSPTPPKKQKQSQLQSSCGVFSVTLYDLGLVCPAALLQRPSLPCSALVAVSAGVLVECRSAPPSGSMPVPISSSSSASCTPTPESPLSHSLYLSMRELQRLCDLCPRETAATRSLSRKLLRLPCLLIEGSAGNSASASGGGGRRCERALFETLGGPRGLGAEGIEQLCNFLAEGLQISVHQPQQVQMRIL